MKPALKMLPQCFFRRLKLNRLLEQDLLKLNRKGYSTNISHNILKSKSSETPLVLAHGVLGNKNNFNSLAKKLFEQTNRTVITYDARNHGKSDHSNTMSLQSMSEDLIELLARLGISECVFVGHSMGGRVAMHTSLNFPQYIKKLVVVDSSPASSFSKSTVNDRGSVLKYVKALIEVDWSNSKTLSEARNSADKQLQPNVPDVSVRNFILTNVEKMSSGSLGWRVNLDAICKYLEQMHEMGTSESSQAYNKPTLFICGGESTFVRVEDYPLIKKLFPQATITHIPGAGHWVHSEKPKEFLSCLVSFLQPSPIPLF